MDDPILDFRFGWRWLLPVSNCRSYRLCGLSPEEQRFWADTLALAGGGDNGPCADLWIINADHWKSSRAAAANNYHLARVVCIVGSSGQMPAWRRTMQKIFPQIREYGLLPPANPRIVVPLSSPRLAGTGLSLHRPGRRRAKLGVQAARFFLKAGNDSLLRRRTLLIALQRMEAPVAGKAYTKVEQDLLAGAKDCALYLGTPDRNRKTVVLPLGESKPGTILKIAETKTAYTALKNEAAALSALARTSLAPNVPTLNVLVERPKSLTLYQEYRNRKIVNFRKMNAALAEFLGGLTCTGREKRPLSSLLNNLPHYPNTEKLAGKGKHIHQWLNWLNDAAQFGMTLWVHRSHGDFAPWNCAWTRSGLFVYDWEKSREKDLAFSDAFYYAVATALHVKRKPNVYKTIEKALCLAGKMADAGGLHSGNIKIYFGLWLMQRNNQAELYNEVLQKLVQGMEY